MGAGELAYRVRHAAQAQCERRCFGRAWLAKRGLVGRFDVLALKRVKLGSPLRWDPR